MWFTIKKENSNHFKYFSLELSPFTGLNKYNENPFIEKVMNELFEHFNKLFLFKGLRKYKEKLEPLWEDRYIVYKGNYSSFIKIVLTFTKITEKWVNIFNLGLNFIDYVFQSSMHFDLNV